MPPQPPAVPKSRLPLLEEAHSPLAHTCRSDMLLPQLLLGATRHSYEVPLALPRKGRQLFGTHISPSNQVELQSTASWKGGQPLRVYARATFLSDLVSGRTGGEQALLPSSLSPEPGAFAPLPPTSDPPLT